MAAETAALQENLVAQQEEDMAVDDVQEIEALAELGIAAGRCCVGGGERSCSSSTVLHTQPSAA
jgi:hypothetical protein